MQEAPCGVKESKGMGKQCGWAVIIAGGQGLAILHHLVLGRHSEESKSSKVEPGLPGLYKDIFVRVGR